MRRHFRAAAYVATLGLVWAAACAKPEPADVVFYNGNIYTLVGDPPASVETEPVVAALAVRGGRIVAIGSNESVQRYRGGTTQVHDLGGATVFPGWVDCHVHLQSLGRQQRNVDLVGTASYAEIIERVQARAATQPPGTWVTGRGWDQNDWPETQFPDHAALSRAVASHPVYLRRIDGHAALVNAAALALADLDATADPPGGRIVRRADGSPSGVLVDAAMQLVSSHIPTPDAAERRATLRTALAHCAAAGLTGVHDAGVSPDELADDRLLLTAGELPLRVYAMLDGRASADSSSLVAMCAAGPQDFDPTAHLAVRCVKLMADGALGSRGAALAEPYSDAPEEYGLPQYTPEEFYARVRPLHAAGFQLATHCIGDAANRMVLDAYERLQRELPRPDARHRIEHAQILALADVPRFAALHVLPSMQPTHCTSDMPWAPVRLGAERLRGAYAWRALRDTGVIIPAGSDAPVESVAPLLGIYAAVTRRDLQGHPDGGWQPEQCLTRSEALRGFTSWAARASFTEADLGTLELGKRADLTVVDRDVMRVPAEEIPTARIRLTVVGGEVVYAAESSP